jgi:UTRA domain
MTRRLRWHLSEFEDPDHTMLASSDAWETDIERQGHNPTRQDLAVEIAQPTPDSAARRALGPDDAVVIRRRVRHIDGKPAMISDDYFDEKIVRGTELAAPQDTTRENVAGSCSARSGCCRESVLPLAIPSGTGSSASAFWCSARPASHSPLSDAGKAPAVERAIKQTRATRTASGHASCGNFPTASRAHLRRATGVGLSLRTHGMRGHHASPA